ncbi:MAG: 3'-5'-exoribonuclease, partial [Pleopsidium flavum]
MSDRRRINGPSGGTAPPVYASSLIKAHTAANQPSRTRRPDELRKIFLKTGLTPSASGSAYFELEPSPSSKTHELSLQGPSSALKLTCTVHGPKPLPRSAPFTPHILLSTHVKFAPFAARQRRGYVRDASERDLSVHLETALRGVIIGDRWPKSGVEVVITIIEGDEDHWWGDEAATKITGSGGIGPWAMMNVLAGCITVASAAIADAGIDCVDLVSGGVAAIVEPSGQQNFGQRDNVAQSGKTLQNGSHVVLDPCPCEHQDVIGACVVGYLAGRDELTELWLKGRLSSSSTDTQVTVASQEVLVDHAVASAMEARLVLEAAMKEAVEYRSRRNRTDSSDANTQAKD